MTLPEANRIVGGLSAPSFLPCKAYNLDARNCITGSKLVSVPGSTCSGCYALRNSYNYPAVRAAMERRLEALLHPQWAEAMALLINHELAKGIDVFRWHDAGDIQSEWHLGRIATVATRTPNVRHWLPTREYAIVKHWLATNACPPNLIIRLSGHMVDRPPPTASNLPTQVVYTSSCPSYAFACPAVETKRFKCLDCRACWDPSIACIGTKAF